MYGKCPESPQKKEINARYAEKISIDTVLGHLKLPKIEPEHFEQSKNISKIIKFFNLTISFSCFISKRQKAKTNNKGSKYSVKKCTRNEKIISKQ